MISTINLIKCPSTWSHQDSMDYREVNVDVHSDEFKWMKELFTNTIWPGHKGSPGLSPIYYSNLEVKRLVRIQNPMQWLRYRDRKQHILDQNSGKCSYVSKVLTATPKSPLVDPLANEFFLLHGLNTANATGICKFGFDPRYCSLEGMYGAGLYFAENSSKSNQYSHSGACTASGFKPGSCRCAQSDEVCMLVCRVVLGDCLLENVYRGNAPGQFWHGRRTEPTKSVFGGPPSIYNSVLGESKINFGPSAALQLREYIVYESSQVYPEYKVFYKRVK